MLSVERVGKEYRVGGMFSGERRQVLRSISFTCDAGECVGIIGESGSGKSTLGRLILGIEKPDQGTICWEGSPVIRRTTRMSCISAVFQDYTSSMNPYYTVERAIAEPMVVMKLPRRDIERKVGELLERVDLHSSYRSKHAHELSGGEAQRVCIARAISTEPRLIVLDEAVSSLDASVQTQVLELLKDLRLSYRMGYIFITHDIQAAAYLCDKIIVIRGGELVESVRTEQLGDVQSAYARKLLDMVLM